MNENKSDDLFKRNFRENKPLIKAVIEITEIKCKDGNLYISAIFDCYDLTVFGLAMDTNIKSPLCVKTIQNSILAYQSLKSVLFTVIEDHNIPAKPITRKLINRK